MLSPTKSLVGHSKKRQFWSLKTSFSSVSFHCFPKIDPNPKAHLFVNIGHAFSNSPSGKATQTFRDFWFSNTFLLFNFPNTTSSLGNSPSPAYHMPASPGQSESRENVWSTHEYFYHTWDPRVLSCSERHGHLQPGHQARSEGQQTPCTFRSVYEQSWQLNRAEMAGGSKGTSACDQLWASWAVETIQSWGNVSLYIHMAPQPFCKENSFSK